MGFSYEITDLTTLRAIKQSIFKSIFDYQYEDVFFTAGISARKVGTNYTLEYHRNEARKIEVPINKVNSRIRMNKWNKLDTVTYSDEEILNIIRLEFKSIVNRYDKSELDSNTKLYKSKYGDNYYVKYFSKDRNRQAEFVIDITKAHTIADRNRRRLKNV